MIVEEQDFINKIGYVLGNLELSPVFVKRLASPLLRSKARVDIATRLFVMAAHNQSFSNQQYALQFLLRNTSKTSVSTQLLKGHFGRDRKVQFYGYFIIP